MHCINILDIADFLYSTIKILTMCWTFLQLQVTLPLLCGIIAPQVSSGITILDSCNTVCIADNIKINEKIVYLLMSLFGQLAPMIQMVLGGVSWLRHRCPHIWTNSGFKQTTWVLVH